MLRRIFRKKTPANSRYKQSPIWVELFANLVALFMVLPFMMVFIMIEFLKSTGLMD